MLKSHIKGYQKKFKKYGVDPRSLQWISKKWADLRYREITKDIEFEGKTILDVGCGFSDIIGFIKKKAKNFEYTGVDLVPEFIKVCKKKYPSYKFLINDYFETPIEIKFDIVITSGTLNANIKNPYKYRTEAIKVMWEHSKEIVAFNMAGGYPQPENKKGNRVYYANLDKIVDFCKSLTTNINVRKDYSPNDFTVIMFK